MSNQVIYSTRVLEGWMIGVITTMSVLLTKEVTVNAFYRFGPSSTLVILGLPINTVGMYVGVLIYCFINTCIRNLNNQIVSPWVTNVVHDTTVSKEHLSTFMIYEVVIISVIYTWVDWFIYINLLLAQADMVIVEICTDLIVTGFVTRMYLNTPVEEHVPMEVSLQSPLMNN
jgi:hypothetical protein